MSASKLMKRERAVINQIVSKPHRSNIDLANEIGISVSTFSTIRSRLRKRGLFSVVNFPNLAHHDTEMILALFGYFKPCFSEQDITDGIARLKDRYRNVLVHWMSEENFVILAVGRNYTDLQAFLLEFKHEFSDIIDSADRNALQEVIIPLSNARVPSFFDYDHILSLAFGTPAFDDGLRHRDLLDPSARERPGTPLTRTERQVLLALLDDSSLTDVAIARHINKTRHTVSKARSRFIDEGQYHPVALLDLDRMGYEILVVAHITFSLSTDLSSRTDVWKSLQGYLPTFLFVEDDQEAVVFMAFKDFTEFSFHRKNMVCQLAQNGLIERLPSILTFSIPRMREYRSLAGHHYLESVLFPDP